VYLPAPDESTWIGTLRLVLRVPGSRSLKDKRRALNQVRDKLRTRHNLSVAEVGHLEDHRRAILVAVMVANDSRFVRSALDGLIHEVRGWRAAEIDDAQISLMRPDDGTAPPHYDGPQHG
jgi:uncharacterized protein YlxP (DUF503 family)